MAFDPASNGSVLFGGVGGSYYDYVELSTTWFLQNGTWENLTSALRTAPSARNGASMVYDAHDHELLLFGGSHPGASVPSPPVALNDTWAYRGGAWVNITRNSTTEPAPRYSAGMAYDAATGSVVLYGGGYGWNGRRNDTWEFSGGNWSNISRTVGAGPPALVGPDMAYDSTDSAVVLYGGDSSRTFPNSTWEYTAGAWKNVTSGVSPGANYRGTLVDDPADSGVVLAAGENLTGFVRSTWEFHSGNWSRVNASVAPAGMFEAMGDYDPTLSRVVLYGGENGAGYNVADNQLWYFHSGNWTAEDRSTVPPMTGAPQEAFDATDHEFVLLIGNQTWTSPDGRNWTALNTTREPGFHKDASMTYDWSDGYVLLFGGANATTTLGDTWAFSAGNWTKLSPKTAPFGRTYGALTYDSADGYVLLFGGEGFSDTWKFHGGNWTQLSATGPSKRAGAAMAYDSADGYVVLFGGLDLSGGAEFPGDTWTFQNGTWRNITPYLRNSPTGTACAGEVNDSFSGALTLFGGLGYYGGCCDETWEFLGGQWIPMNLTPTPGARGPMGFAAGAQDNASVLFGGSSAFGLEVLGDSWAWYGRPLITVSSFIATPTRIDLGNSTHLQVMARSTRGILDYRYSGLPPGCSTQNGSALNCSPNATGTFNVTVWVTNQTWGLNASSNLTLTVAAGLVLVSFHSTPPVLDAQQSFSLVANATGGFRPLAYTYLGLPSGCASQDSATLSCSGVPAGSYDLTAYVNDSSRASVHGSTVVTVDSRPSILGVAVSPNAPDAGEPFSVRTSLTGGTVPIAWSYSGLPYGCSTVDSAILNCSSPNAGEYNVTVTAQDAAAVSATRTILLQVYAVPTVASFTVTPSPVTVNSTTLFTASVVGGSPPLTYAYQGLPKGCVSSNSSSLACMPTVTGDFTVSVRITDGQGRNASSAVGLTVRAAPLPISGHISVLPARLEVGQSTTISVVPSGGTGTYSFAYVGLPGGCSSQNLSVLVCRPTQSGTVVVDATIRDSAGASTDLRATIDVLAPLRITEFGLNRTTVVEGGSVMFTANTTGGAPPLSFTYLGLPPGCASANLSQVVCTVNSTGNFSITLKVEDSLGVAQTANASLSVARGAPACECGGPIQLPIWIIILVATVATGALGIVGYWAIRRRRGPPPTASEGV